VLKMIVDCHTHISFAADDIETAEHLAAAEGVDVCIVLAAPNGPTEDANKRLSAYVSRHKDKLIGFAVVEPTKDKGSISYLKSLIEKQGFDGVVMYCSANGFHPAHSKAMQFYKSAEELRIPVFFHNSGHLGANAILDFAQPYLLDEVARTFPALKIVIGCMGVPFIEQTLEMVSKHKNVYADLSIRPSNVWQVYNIVIGAYERGVMDKLLFGSGFPFGNTQECMETLLGFNMLLADTNLPTVPRGNIRGIIERDTLGVLGIKRDWADKLRTADTRDYGARKVGK
jgi:predicted TIM-barrel fold metal-dependent hydrolase